MKTTKEKPATRATKEERAFARSVARAAKKKGISKTLEAAMRLQGHLVVYDPSIFEFDH
ncbi:MAG: hypothetical protein LBN24_03000 [Mediterranea sp.]|jgi:hypothetical protein|nr:hypothetical protein [Mediterranea sp.]